MGRIPGGNLARLIDSVAHLTGRIVWLVVVVVLAAGAGRLWLFPAPKADRPALAGRTALVPPPLPRQDLDEALTHALLRARAEALADASARLDAWEAELMTRVDDEFLDWYFSYWNQNALGLKSIWYWGREKVLPGQPTAGERITEDIEEAFRTRVLRPRIAQRELERIADEVMEGYAASLRKHILAVPGERKIPEGEWDRYLADLAAVAGDVEGGRTVGLGLKAAAGGSALGAALAWRTAAPIALGAARLASRMAGRTAARAASRAGVKLAGRAGGKFLGPLIGTGVLAWDVWDHYRTKRTQRPVLRRNIQDYLDEMKVSLLKDPERGILAVVHDFEIGVRLAMPEA